jgi:integrase
VKPYRKSAGLNPDGTKRFSPYWWISFEDAGGRRVHESTQTTNLTEAKAILADRQAAVRSKGLFFENLAKEFTFKEMAEDYFAWNVLQHKSGRQQVKPRLVHLVAFFGRQDIAKISSQDLINYRAKRLKEKVGGVHSTKCVSASTINRELDTLNAAYNWAKGEDKYRNMIRYNPYVRRKHRTKEPDSARGWFDSEGKRRFLEAVDQLPATKKHFPPDLLRDIVIVLWATGMRIVECLSLRKRQVKLEYCLVQLEGWQTKNKKAGDVDLRTDEAFQVFRRACQGKKDNDLVFNWPDGDALRQPERCKKKRLPGEIPYSAVQSAFKAACAVAGLSNITLHSCRKTAATEMAIEGYSPLAIKDALHHQDITTTLRYISQTAVSQAQRQKRNQLKVPGTFGDTVGPSGGVAASGTGNSATQVLHKPLSGQEQVHETQ